jgi:hypothetical protein
MEGEAFWEAVAQFLSSITSDLFYTRSFPSNTKSNNLTVKNTFDFRGFGYLENQLHTPKIKTSIEKHEFLPLKAKYVSESKGFNPLFSMRVK